MTTAGRLDRVERLNLLLGGAAVVGALALASGRFVVSLAVGVGIQAANYRTLRRMGERLFAGELRGGRAWTAGFGLRFALVGAAMLAALLAGADPIALVIGLSAIVPAVLFGAWRAGPPRGNFPAPPSPEDPSWDEWDPWRAREREAAEEEDA